IGERETGRLTRGRIMRFWTLSVAFVLVAPMACASSQVPPAGALRSGVYPLQRYGGMPVPADLGPLGPKGVPGDTIPRDPGGCHILVTGGALTLDIDAMRYSFWYEWRNACNQMVLSKPGLDGTFEQHGDALVFHFHRVDGETSFRGLVNPSGITLFTGRDLDFKR